MARNRRERAVAADKPFLKKIVPRLSFKSNLVALVFSLVRTLQTPSGTR